MPLVYNTHAPNSSRLIVESGNIDILTRMYAYIACILNVR